MRAWVVCAVLSAAAANGSAQISVPSAPAATSKAHSYHDRRYGVRFAIPPGWSWTKKDGVVSTFHLDARSASLRARMRGVATMDFNPLPQSTLSGASMYYSVEPHVTDAECAAQAAPGKGRPDIVNIGGMDFVHGHDEQRHICIEARDEIYTAYRKHSCYRFDLTVNTFCSISSGAEELTDEQLRDVEVRMTGMLSTVVFSWEKGGAHPVPLPLTVSVR